MTTLPDKLHPQRVQRRTLAVLSLAQIIGGVGVAVGVAFSALVVAELSGSAVISGYAGTSMVLGAALMALPIARAADRWGRRAALSLAYAGAAVGAVISVLGITIANWPVLLFGFLLLGGGSAGNLAARYSATDLSPPGHTARHLSLVVWMTTIGSVTGPNLAGPADRLGQDLGLAETAGPFALSALAFVLALVIIQAALRPDPLLLARRLDGAAPGASARRFNLRESWQVLRSSPAAMRALVAIAVSQTAMVSIMSMTPVHLNHGGASLEIIGLTLSLHIAGMYVLSPVVGKLADKAGTVPVLVLGMVILLAAAVLAATAGHGTVQIAVALVLLGLGWSCGLVAGSALLTESVPVERRPSVQGFSDLLMNVCGAGGTVLAGFIVGWLSYGVLGAAVGVLVTLTGLWLLTTRHRTTPA
ncbi:MFS transporter [Nonomuraea sp. NPDC050328]|uniref:MFS transporter n=1 Tax=Nonomuraea sp. NPDC050328 TaxID=3364361 RepID=UPI00379B5674